MCARGSVQTCGVRSCDVLAFSTDMITTDWIIKTP